VREGEGRLCEERGAGHFGTLRGGERWKISGSRGEAHAVGGRVSWLMRLEAEVSGELVKARVSRKNSPKCFRSTRCHEIIFGNVKVVFRLSTVKISPECDEKTLPPFRKEMVLLGPSKLTRWSPEEFAGRSVQRKSRNRGSR